MSDTQHQTAAPIGEDERVCRPSTQWLLECAADERTPIHRHNRLEVMICGEMAFASIAEDISKAKSSVDIICWGFDPAMEVIREKDAGTWPRGKTWGGLLRDVAQGKYNHGRPVQVRLLVWYSMLGNKATNNMPGYRQDSKYERTHTPFTWESVPEEKEPARPTPTEAKDQREMFNSHWYRKAFAGELSNLFIRTRGMGLVPVFKSLKDEGKSLDLTEFGGMEIVPTDHQKTILIDYEHEGGVDAIGYVMGLNSVTDYWDTQEHLFNEPRRGAAWEGADDTQPGLKPYQDYACRTQGDALVSLSKNFTDAWNRAKGMGPSLARQHDVHHAPAGLTAKLGPTGQNALIVRTQPEEGDKSIKRLYAQASSSARRYVYIENQYFQYTEWAQQLRITREEVVKLWGKAGKDLADLPNLHVMVVIPTPERVQMVPRTCDTAKTLGQGTSMPDQDKAVDEEMQRHAQQQVRWDAYVQSQTAKGLTPDPDMAPPPLSPIVQSAKSVGSQDNVVKELNALGMRTLVASLWTYDHDWRSSQRTELGQFAASEKTAVPSQHRQQLTDKLLRGRYREIYIHSKLMMIDDAMFTLGSANLNLRSMAVDAELNIASDDPGCCSDLRWRVWRQHSGEADGCDGGTGSSRDVAQAFTNWKKLMLRNTNARPKGDAPTGFLFCFEDKRTSWIRLS